MSTGFQFWNMREYIELMSISSDCICFLNLTFSMIGILPFILFLLMSKDKTEDYLRIKLCSSSFNSLSSCFRYWLLSYTLLLSPILIWELKLFLWYFWFNFETSGEVSFPFVPKTLKFDFLTPSASKEKTKTNLIN